MWKDLQFEMSLYYWELLTPEEQRQLRRKIVRYIFLKRARKVGERLMQFTWWRGQPRLQQSESNP